MAAVRPHDDLVARLVAWHNRHPFARRIAPAQVLSVGLVSFPFHAPAADVPPPAPVQPLPEAPGRLRERARARAGQAGAEGAAASSSALRPDDDAAAPSRKGWRAAFTDNLLDPQSPRALVRWLLRHGSRARPGPADAPVRDVDVAAPAPPGTAVARLWVHTAAIELGAQRVRVLASPLGRQHVFGPRIMAAGRVGAWAGAAIATTAALAAALWLVGHPGPFRGGADTRIAASTVASTATNTGANTAASTAPGAPGPSGPATAARPNAVASNAVPPATSASATGADSTVASRPSSVPPAAMEAAAAAASPTAELSASGVAEAAARPRPPPAPHVRLSGPWIRSLAPTLSDDVRRQAREASEAARAERARLVAARALAGGAGGEHAAAAQPTVGAGPAPTGRLPAPQAVGAAARTPSAQASPPRAATAATQAPSGAQAATATAATTATGAATAPASAWAVSTRRLRTRFESEQMLAALRDVAYRSGYGSELRLEVMPAGDDWRAVGWPLATRAEAERLRATLAERGLKAEVVQF